MEHSKNLDEALERTCNILNEKGKKINLTLYKIENIKKKMFQEIWISRKQKI